MPRLFVAVRVQPTDPLRAALKRMEDLRGVKAVAPENLHYTMRFIGDVSDAIAKAIREAFAQGRLDMRPFDVEMRGVGAFPNPRDPRVVWVGADDEGDKGLHRIAQGIDDFLDEAGIGSRDKPFVAHLTLARVKRPSGRATDDLKAILDDLRQAEFGTTRVEAVKLVESTLTDKGPIYEDIAELRLA